MAELFMECEEEELEPWQQKSKPIIVDDDDDDDEPIFVGEILSSKPTNTYILNRVNSSSARVAVQNGTAKRGFQPVARPAASTLAVHPQPRAGSLPGTPAGLQKPPAGGSSPQDVAKSSSGISQPVGRSTPTPSLSRNMPVIAQSPSRPVATVTAQPVALNRVPSSNTSGMVFGLRQSPGSPQCPGGSAVTAIGMSKRPAPSEMDSVSPKKAKADETGSGSSPPVSPLVKSPNEVLSLQKGVASGGAKNGAPFPQACPKCNIHFNLLDPLKNHMKYCCPDLVHTFLGAPAADSPGALSKMAADSEKGKLIMLVNDFYYGHYEGNVQQVKQEQKTHTTFKCASCMKVLKSNLRFMNHMKHHLELEKQESWESHTTCQHCYRQFPTPFQLQCHIESTHTPYESSTVCRICELSFETEQILLQHMKDNHKPGEMPYVCQVCNYRSSAFSDVEKHFRAVHENTKNLLCPFCLKVIKMGAPYMHHYMRHQKKGVQRCNKCRLQFLTGKEKVDHKSQHHRTFRKPPQLEGLPPGTKVTIRASLGSLPPGATTTPLVGTSTSTLQLSPNVKMANTKTYTKLNVSKAKPKLKPLSVQKRQSSAGIGSNGSNNGSASKKNNKIANTALSSLRCSEIQKCIECSSDIRTFASHFPAYVHCSLCRYSTSCSKAYVNHMMSFHSARQSKRYWIYKDHSEELRGITTVCLNCDFIMDDSGLDKMAAHLNESRSHRCQVIAENVSLKDGAAEDLLNRTKDVSPLNHGGEGTSQDLSAPGPPEEQGGMLAPASSETISSAEGTNKDQLGQGDEAILVDQREEEASQPSLEDSSSPALPVTSQNPPQEGSESSLGGCLGADSAAAGSEEGAAAPSGHGPSSGLEDQTSSEGPVGSGEADQSGTQPGEGAAVAAEGGESSPPPVCEPSPAPGLPDCSEDPGETLNAGSLPEHLAERTEAAEGGESSPPSVPEHASSPGPAVHTEDRKVSAAESNAGSPESPVAESSGAECDRNAPVVENSPGRAPSACPEDLGASAEEPQRFGSQADDGCAAAACEETVAPASAVEPSSSPGLSACSEDANKTAEEAEGDDPERGVKETPVAAECQDRVSAPLGGSSDGGAQELPLEGSAGAATKGSPGNQVAVPAAPCEDSSPAPPAGDSPSPEVQPCTVEPPHSKGSGSDDSATEDRAGDSPSKKPPGEDPRPGSGDQQPESDVEEPELEEVDADSSQQASDAEVSFEQFLRRRDEPESVSSDVSEQGSVHLEPLTPSEVLEHEATEILQKGGSVASSAKTSGPGSEPAELEASREGSPDPPEAAAAAASQPEESQDDS